MRTLNTDSCLNTGTDNGSNIPFFNEERFSLTGISPVHPNHSVSIKPLAFFHLQTIPSPPSHVTKGGELLSDTFGVKFSSSKNPAWAARLALIAILAVSTPLSLNADIWIGMSKGELLKELGPPNSTLAVGPKELHDYGDRKTVEILNDRVIALSGFDESIIIEVKQSAKSDTVKASTAYANTANRAKRASDFVDFKALKKTPEETFTLSSSSTSTPNENRLKELLNSKATTFYILGGGLVACVLIGITVSLLRSRKKVPLKDSHIGQSDHILPPFLQSTPTEKPSLTDPRGDMSDLREERLAQRDDPDSMGLSIKASPYQDFDPSIPRMPLVNSENAPNGNAAYSPESQASNVSRKPTRKSRGPETKEHEKTAKRKPTLKLESR